MSHFVEERRRQQRASLVVQIDWRGHHAVSIGKTVNISVGGLRVESSDTLPPQSRIELKFILPLPQGAVVIEATGQVVEERPGQYMGIRFLELSEAHRQAITAYVEKRSSV